ncbi:MAG TPA: lamin tail domain-containing protein, partial [Candidatus Paceibacterota bacterium]|nr:lamin tail domain-containing protein [Candidatus Paceibacterota bacterium]
MDTILNQLYTELQTQKVLLVGHSQGAFYTNEIYKYLIAHGVSKDSVAVYNIASPANYVAGNGTYLTSTNDKMIDAVRRGVLSEPVLYGINLPLAPNVVIAPSTDDEWGHYFAPTYLAKVPNTIVGDIKGALSKLSASGDKDECFTPPSGSLLHKTGVLVGDYGLSTIESAYVAGVGAFNGLGATVASAVGLGKQIASDIGVTVGGVVGLSHAADSKSTPTNFDILNKLYGSSLSKEDLEDLLGNQGSAVASADFFNQPVPPVPQTPEAPTSTQKITYLSGSGSSSPNDIELSPNEPDATTTDPLATTSEPVATTTDPTASSTDPVATTTDPTASSTPPAATSTEPSALAGKVVINEIAWAGTYTSSADQWIELYNASSDDIDLASTSISVDTSTSVPLSGIISGKSFVVVERTSGVIRDDSPPRDIVANFGPLTASASQISLLDSDGKVIDTTPEANACGG